MTTCPHCGRDVDTDPPPYRLSEKPVPPRGPGSTKASRERAKAELAAALERKTERYGVDR